MKKYIILGATISNMGGAEQYLCAKMAWLRTHGWSVSLFLYRKGRIMMDVDMDNIHYLKELQYPSYYYSEKKQNKILRNLLDIVGSIEDTKVVIESTIVSLSTWGESLSQLIGAKHIIYSLQEKDEVRNNSIIDFLKFKHQRRELAGITETSIARMFRSFGITIPKEKSYVLPAYYQDVLKNYEHPLTNKMKEMSYDYAIGSIGRLEKPFVLPTIKSVLEYVKRDLSHHYLLLLIGDTAEGCDRRKKIVDLCTGLSNLTLLITGYLYPIPIDLVQSCDIFFSSSGSAGVSTRCGVPTVSIDGRDLKPIGVVGYTTESRLFRTTEPVRPVEDYLDEILKEKKYPKTSFKSKSEPDYSSHLQFIEESSNTVVYYDRTRFSWNKGQGFQKFIVPLLGPIIYHKILKVFQKSK